MPGKALEYQSACFHLFVNEQRPEEGKFCTTLSPGAEHVERFELR